MTADPRGPRWLLVACAVAILGGIALMLADRALARVVVDNDVVAGLLSPDGLTADRAALAVGYVLLRLAAVFGGPALLVGGAVGLAASLSRGLPRSR